MELLSKQKGLKDIFGEDIMSFDDYNYELLNEYILNLAKSTLQSEDQSSHSSFRVDDLDYDTFDQANNSITPKEEVKTTKRKLFNRD